ncbi:12130_t:CDS:2, partial [Gigaspora rosea]
LTDPNTISNSNTNSENNNTSSDESLSGDNISTDLNSITDQSNEARNTDHSNKSIKAPNGQWKCRQLVKTQSSTVTNLQPLYVLKSDSFVKFIHALNPYYELPSDKHVKLKEVILAIKYVPYPHDTESIKAKLEE